MTDRIMLILALIAVAVFGYELVEIHHDRRVMACRDGWPDRPTDAECKELLRSVKPLREPKL
jgi:hypothetical protein